MVVRPGVSSLSSIGFALDAQHHVGTNETSGPATEGTMGAGYDELATAQLPYLTEETPDPCKCANFADTDRNPVRVSENKKRVINHARPRYTSIWG